MYKLFLLSIVLSVSCSAVDNSNIHEEYGEYYFSMDCVWRSYDDGQTLWWCSEDVEVELIEGHLALELLEDGRLSFCGEDLYLNTGHELHDTWVSALTQNQFNCLLTEETELGNEFDWLWHKRDRTLQIIWRPKNDSEKQLTLIIDQGPPATDVIGRVYYKEIF